jgi:acetyl esterase/lipase
LLRHASYLKIKFNMKVINEVNVPGSPSEQIEQVNEWWRQGAIESAKGGSLEHARDKNENWQVLTAEPGEVDYTETEINGLQAMWAVPKNSDADRVVLCFHGGGYFVGSMFTHRKMYAHLAKRIGCRALIINYSLVPEYTYPKQFNEGIMAYEWLLEKGIKPGHIAFAGDSAGGGMTVGVMLSLKEQGLPLPAACMAISPWFDMEGTGDSMVTNTGKDLIFNIQWVKVMAQMFVGENGNLRDPLASPLYGDLKGLPPIYIHVGGDELLLDDSIRLAESGDKAGVDITVDVFPGMQHTFPMAAGRAPESDESLRRFAEWAKPLLGL